MVDSTRTRPQALPVAAPLRQAREKAQAGTRLAVRNADLLLILGLVAIGLLAHSLNMFNYPSSTLLDDEGIYMGQARAVLQTGHLTPYTYFYDHAPAGWVFMAVWLAVSGGLHTFGNAIDSGRIFMLLLHLAMIPLLYHIARKLGAGMSGAVIAGVFFSLSPLAIFYQRMVLLDTIMLFWVLVSLDLLLDGWGRLSRVILSGVCFGIALLSKETALVLLPALVFIAVQQRWKHQGRFAVVGWLVPFLLAASLYPLYAVLKGELFPTGGLMFVGNALGVGAGGKASLIDALVSQIGRDGGGLFNFNNQFWQLLGNDWLTRDALLVIGGILATFINLGRGLLQSNRQAMATGLLGILPLIYLARGGLVLNYYILFAIPFLCLNLAVLLGPVLQLTGRRAGKGLALAGSVALVGGYWLVGTAQPLYQDQPAQAGRDAVTWIKQNVPPQSLIISRDDLWTDLREPGLGGPGFPNVHSHYKVAADPDVRDAVFHNDWHNVDYLIMSPGLEQAFAASNNTIALQALQHAHLVKQWQAPAGDAKLHPQQIVELWKVDKAGDTEAALLPAVANYLNGHFEQNGAYTDSAGDVTAEAQSYALLRAVWSNDQAEFERVWQWTGSHLLTADGLLGRVWRNGTMADNNAGSDADSDAALALLMAGKTWHNPDWQAAGTKLVTAMWQHEVVNVSGTNYLVAGNWATTGQVLAFNPSYFAPYAYRIFASVDPTHNWESIVDSGYQMLVQAANAPLGLAKSDGLPPDWVGLNRETGAWVPLNLARTQTDTTRYGYEAPRAYWRVALDLRWNKDGRADSFLKQAGFLRDEANRLLQDGKSIKNRVSAIYAHDGTVIQEAPSLVGTTGAVAALTTLNPATANKLYAELVLGQLNRSGPSAFWADAKDLYTQEWGWFAVAFYADALPNLWQGQGK